MFENQDNLKVKNIKKKKLSQCQLAISLKKSVYFNKGKKQHQIDVRPVRLLLNK